MPFITEEIWQRIPWTEGSILVASFPDEADALADGSAVEEMDWFRNAVTAIRNVRGELSISPSETVRAIVVPNSGAGVEKLEGNRHLIEKFARVSDLEITLERKPPEKGVTAVMGRLEVFLPLDETRFAEEKRRLEKEIQKTEKELDFVRKKLCNQAFRTKAPQEVVTKEEAKELELENVKSRLEEGLRRLGVFDSGELSVGPQRNG
jgi:valyl-tRNA synthetase